MEEKVKDFELLLPTGGGWFQSGTGWVSFEPGSALLLAPDTPRRLPLGAAQAPIPAARLPENFEPPGPAGEPLRAARESGWLCLRPGEGERESLCGCLRALQMLGEGEYAGQAREHLALAALLLLERCRRRTLPVPPGRRRTGETLAEAALRLIGEGYAEELTLQGLAKKLYVSPSHLSRVLRRQTGRTFGQVLLLTRLRQAKGLLRDTGDLAIDIAVACGFSSAQHFCAAFKRESGMTPLQYRRACRGKMAADG